VGNWDFIFHPHPLVWLHLGKQLSDREGQIKKMESNLPLIPAQLNNQYAEWNFKKNKGMDYTVVMRLQLKLSI